MIYRILKLLIKIAVRVFFRSVEWKNSDKIPGEDSPLLVVANHPGTFMDPLVIAVNFNRPVFFLAKAEVFKSKFAARILPKFNMIPVYRKQDDESQMHRNEETFEKCFEHLSGGGTILIFPEGISLTERKLRKIKTGAARIALGAEAKNNFNLDVKILPLGINYSHDIKFQSNLFIKVGQPINAGEYKDVYAQNGFAAVEKLTEEIRSGLEGLIIAVEDDETDRLVKQIEKIFKNKALKDRGVAPDNMEEDHEVTKKIVFAVQYFNENEPDRVRRIKEEVENYFSTLERLNISDKWLEGFSKGGSLFFGAIATAVYLIAGFPLYLFGVVNNYLPYKLPYIAAKKMTNRPEFVGAITMALGILSFILFYSIQLYFVYRLTHNLAVVLLYFLLLPVSGFFAFKYWKRFINIKGKLFVITLFMKRSAITASLIKQREDIIEELQKGREEYNKIK